MLKVSPIGIAGKYRNDAGIAQDPDVLYSGSFNDGLDKICSRYSDVRNRDGMWLDSKDVPDGSKVPALVMTNKGGVNDGGHLYRIFKPGFDGTIYLRYYVKYPASSKGYIHHESVWIGAIIRLLPGQIRGRGFVAWAIKGFPWLTNLF
ncbi:hypothetical protein [Mucilaginibacter antarcticus]|uniref:hypothetical protein n=1 Tax=Mucilaginibacter antarcticus TaxID=1855725 RepID=UPI003631A8E3